MFNAMWLGICEHRRLSFLTTSYTISGSQGRHTSISSWFTIHTPIIRGIMLSLLQKPSSPFPPMQISTGDFAVEILTLSRFIGKHINTLKRRGQTRKENKSRKQKLSPFSFPSFPFFFHSLSMNAQRLSSDRMNTLKRHSITSAAGCPP